MVDLEPAHILLTKREVVMGAECGVTRNICSWDYQDAYGFEEEHGWNAHIEGACGEIAVAKLLNRFWSPTVNTFDAADIGMKIQVRTRSRHDYELYIRPEDNPEHAFVLVTGKAPMFMVRGWLLARNARCDEWLQTYGGRPPAWFVPTSALWPWRDLRHRASLVEAAE